MNLLRRVKLCPVAGGICYSEEAAFKLAVADGWHFVEVFGRKLERSASFVDLLKAKAPLTAYHVRGQFVTSNFDSARRLFGTSLKNVRLLGNMNDLEIAHFLPLRQELFYVRKSALPALLATALADLKSGKTLQHKKGMTPEQVYALGVLAMVLAEEKEKLHAESLPGRIKKSFAVAGAKLLEWKSVAQGLIDVTWSFLSETFISTVYEKDLRVMQAGICLAGADKRHTLATLPCAVQQAVDEDGLHITRRV